MAKILPALTSLRFFAAAMIVTTHTADFFHIGIEITKRLIMAQGVSFFFVLSGFVLFYAHREMQDSARLTFTQFMRARFARVWPAHAVTMLAYCYIFLYVLGLEDPLTYGRTFTTGLLLQAWVPYSTYYFGFNGVAWSLSVEMFLYAMFPFLISRWSHTWHWKCMLAVVLLFVSVTVPGSVALDDWKPGHTGPTIASYTYIFPPAHLLEFVFGMSAASLYVRFTGRLESMNIVAINVIEIVAMAGAIWGLFEMPRISGLLESSGYVDSGFRSWLTISGASPFVAVMLFAMSSGRGVLGRALALRPMVLLGEISFSLYLVHQLVSRVWLLRKDFAAEYSDLARYLAYWAFVLLLSYLLWRFVEKPAQLLLMGKLRATEAPKPVSM
ncbi:acyltransferase family protein [Cupriavidus sp. Marseille-Q8015]